jgi:hypothetical protein
MKDCIVKVSKVQFDYWYEKGTLGEAVKLQGDVGVLVGRQDFENYINHIEGWKMSKESVKQILKYPAKLLEIAMYEHYEDLIDKFDI